MLRLFKWNLPIIRSQTLGGRILKTDNAPSRNVNGVDTVGSSNTDSALGKGEPFLKWAGGKRFLLSAILPNIPDVRAEATYFEPFLGGGAVFFGLLPKNAVLADLNPSLIETYVVVRDSVHEVISILEKMPHSKEFYYHTRSSRPSSAIERAARFIYLNKTCFNGLYRENLRGEFNVPFGKHSQNLVVCNSDQLIRASNALVNARIDLCDFSIATLTAQAGDVVYFDPPYTTAHSNNGFVEYNAKVFSWDDQRRLANTCAVLIARGVRVVVSNADHPSIENWYLKEGLFNSIRISRWTTIASRSSKRVRTSELLLVSKGARG